MSRYANPFRIAVESFDAHKEELTTNQQGLWFDSFWDEWADMTHDGNCIFEMFNDQLDHTEEVVDYENRIEFINHEIVSSLANGGDMNPVDVDHERALFLVAAEIIDRTWAVYPEMQEAVIPSHEWADALNRLRLNLPWESITVDFELGTESTHFERIVRATFSIDMGVVK